jgi:hypothetical protein
MYKKKRRNKRSDDMMDITFKIVVHALRLSGIEIPKNVLPSQLPAPISRCEEEDVHGSEEEDAHDCGEEHAHDGEEDVCGNEDEANKVHGDSRSPMLDTIDKPTEPTACSLLDGTRINVEPALVKVFPFKKSCHAYRCRMGMLWCNLLMCGPIRVTTPYLYQYMGVI